MNEGRREDAILWEGKPVAGFFGGRGSLMVSQYQVGIVMQDGEVVDVFSGGKRDLPKGEVRTYVASTAPFTLTFWLMDPMDREEPDDGVVLGQPVLTSDDEAVTGRLALTMRVVRKNVEYLLQLLRPGRGGVTRRDVSDAIEGELLAKVLALDIHQHTAEELRGNRELFRGIYESVNIELASTIRFYGLRLDNFTVNWGLTSEERERIRERRHEEELREMERLQEIEDLANRWMDRERRHEEELAEIERAKDRERRHEEELREMERQREIFERQRDLLEKQRELMEGRREIEDLTESVRREPSVGRPAEPEMPDETESASSLHEAVLRDDTEAALALIKSGIDVNSRNKLGSTALHLAAMRNHIETIWALVSAGADVNARDKYGWTPLHPAAMLDYTEGVLALVSAGADVNARNKDGWTPLHPAALLGSTEGVLALVSAGADVNARDRWGQTPLYWAASWGNTEGVLALVSAGVDVNARDGWGQTPLHWAAFWGNTETTQALAVVADDIDAMDEIDWTPLHRAAWKGHAETALVLVSAGADVDARSKSGRTPLHLAAEQGDTETGRALVVAGADVNITDEEGLAPWELAYAMGYRETARVVSVVPRGCGSVPGEGEEETALMGKLESTGAGQSAWERYPVGGERYGMNYWVYEERMTNHARVHEETCGHCNYGTGRGHGRIPGDSGWHGPYGSREDAFRKAHATGRREVRGCGHCRP